MAQATICDICGKITTFYDDSFQVKKLKDIPGYEGWHRKCWKQIDMCRDCLNKLYNMQQTQPTRTTSVQNN